MSDFNAEDLSPTPDYYGEQESPFSGRAVWFAEGRDCATEVTVNDYGISVSEYVNFLIFLDEPSIKDYEYPFQKTTVMIEAKDILSLTNGSVQDIKDLDAVEVVRAAAKMGAERITKLGGFQEQVAAVPDVSKLEPNIDNSPIMSL